MQSDDLEDLLEHARSNNGKKGITGALIYVDGAFLQVLEGARVSVEDLMAKILRDVRHETVTVLREGEIPSPIFTDWKMAYVSATSEQVAKWAGLSGTTGISEILTDIRQNPQAAAQVAESILLLLKTENTARSKAD